MSGVHIPGTANSPTNLPMGGAVQIASARRPQPGAMEDSCCVAMCDEPCAVVVSVGGGWARSTSTMSVRLCRGHAEDVANQIREVLTEGETRKRPRKP